MAAPASGRGERLRPLLRLLAVGDNAAMPTEPPKADLPKRKRRWFQFSLRSLMIFTLVCAVASAWLGIKIDQKRKEREAVESIIKDGWTVIYDSQIDPRGNLYMRDQPPGPDWLRKVLGENYFSEAKRVFPSYIDDKTETNCTDAGLERINELPHLEWVGLSGGNVTDVSLARLKGLTELYALYMGYTKVTDAGLEQINGLTQLQSLALTGTAVTDAGLEHIKGLTKLGELRLEGTKVTDAGLKTLEGYSQLHMLLLTDTRVTDAGLDHLKALTKLNELYLDGTKVTDAGLRKVKGYSQLRILSLTGTAVTDAGLGHLKELTNLQELHLERTHVTSAGVKDLQKALPKCTISSGSAKSPIYQPPYIP